MLTAAAADGLLEGSLTCAGISLADGEALDGRLRGGNCRRRVATRDTVAFSSGRRRLQSDDFVIIDYIIYYETVEHAADAEKRRFP